MKQITETWETQAVDKANPGDDKCQHEFEYSPGWFDQFSFQKAICKLCKRLEIQRKVITETEVPDPVTPFQELEKSLKDSPIKSKPVIMNDEYNVMVATGDMIGEAIEKPKEEPVEEPIEP
jgi:hypothetical protein